MSTPKEDVEDLRLEVDRLRDALAQAKESLERIQYAANVLAQKLKDQEPDRIGSVLEMLKKMKEEKK